MENPRNLDDIIFEKRNKAYGAYYLRKNYNTFLMKALVLGSTAFILLFGGAFTYNNYILPKSNHTQVKDGTWVVLPPPVEPPIKKIQIEQPITEKKIETQASIIYLPPRAVIDATDIIETPPPAPKEMDGKIISNKTVEGKEGDFIIPPDAPEISKVIKIDTPDEQKIFIAVEQQPEFPDGQKELYKFLSKNIHYPEQAVRANVSGKVYVSFVVELDGTIANVRITKGIGFSCDEEAERVIKLMPKWTPGKQNGKNVRVFYNMPVVYQLN